MVSCTRTVAGSRLVVVVTQVANVDGLAHRECATRRKTVRCEDPSLEIVTRLCQHRRSAGGQERGLGMRARVWIGLVAAFGTAVSACTTPPAAPTPPPSPSATRTENDIERQTRLDFEAAEKAYRANDAEVSRLFEEGGADKPTRVLLETSTGEYLDSTMSILRQVRERKVRVEGKQSITRVIPGAYSPEELLLTGCEDYTNTRLIDDSGKTLPPVGKPKNIQSIVVRKSEGDWLLFSFDTQQVVSFEDTVCSA